LCQEREPALRAFVVAEGVMVLGRHGQRGLVQYTLTPKPGRLAPNW
jgi:hypothetical protein